MSRRILLLGLVAVLAGLLGFHTFTPEQGLALVRKGSYWNLIVTCGLFAFHIWRSFQSNWRTVREVWLRNWGAALVILGSSLFMQVHEDREFKIVADEVLLSSTAMQLHYHREASGVMRAYDYAGNFVPLNTRLDKRPPFFPFLVATAHDLTGYRVENVFYVNAALTFALCFLLYVIGARAGGRPAGICAVLLVASIPLVSQNTVGGGFELLNLVMILATLWLGLRYADAPDDERLATFALSGVLLTQVRYESALFVLPVGASILYVWLKQRRICLPWTVIFVPLLLVLSPLQYNVFKLSEAAWQLKDIEGATNPFGLRYFYDNIGHAMNFFLSTGGDQPNSLLVGVLGIAATGFLGLRIYKEGKSIWACKPADVVLIFFLVSLVFHGLLMMFYFWGRWDDPVIRRLSLPTHLLFILALVYMWASVVTWRRGWNLLASLIVLQVVSLSLPAMSRHEYSQENFAARATNWISDYAKNFSGKNVLAIDENAGLVWFLHRQSSMDINSLARRTDAFSFHFNRQTFDEYIVVQRGNRELASGKLVVSPLHDVGAGMILERVAEKSFAPFYIVRISRVVGLDSAKLKAWAEKRLASPEDQSKKPLVLVIEPEEDVSLWLKNLP